MRLGKEGAFYQFGSMRFHFKTLVHKVAIWGENLLQTPFILHSDEEHSLQDRHEAYLHFSIFVLVGFSS